MICNQPEACFQCFTFDEQQLLQEAGFVVSVPLQGGTGSMTSPMIVNDVTNNRYDDNGTVSTLHGGLLSHQPAAATADQGCACPESELYPILIPGEYPDPAGVRGTNPKLNPGASCTWAKLQDRHSFLNPRTPTTISN